MLMIMRGLLFQMWDAFRIFGMFQNYIPHFHSCYLFPFFSLNWSFSLSNAGTYAFLLTFKSTSFLSLLLDFHSKWKAKIIRDTIGFLLFSIRVFHSLNGLRPEFHFFLSLFSPVSFPGRRGLQEVKVPLRSMDWIFFAFSLFSPNSKWILLVWIVNSI